MKKLVLSTLSVLTAMVFMIACSEENIAPKSSSTNVKDGSTKGSTNSTSLAADYDINVSVDGKTWTYTVTRKPGAKALSHFIVDLNNCSDESASLADVLSASVNGVAVSLKDTEGSGTGCAITSNNFIKFDNLDNSSVYVLSFTLDRVYSRLETAAGWVKAGTSCNQIVVPAPGCPVGEACSMSQGFYFGNGAYNNGAAGVWAAAGGVTLGGNTYTMAEGHELWDSKGIHQYAVAKAFFQYATIQLSQTDLSNEPELQAAVDVIEAYFLAVPKLTPANAATINSSALNTYAGFIGNWVNDNHCAD
jgi:hypothetical protein